MARTSDDARVTYVDLLIAKLGAAKSIVGGRRAFTLLRNVVARDTLPRG